MAAYNGLVAKLVKGTSTGGEFAVMTGTSYVVTVDAFPTKGIRNTLVGVRTTGISGSFSVKVVSAVGGATYVSAGSGTVSANGSTIVGLTASLGSHGSLTTAKPVYVAFTTVTNSSGFNASVFASGDY